MTRAWDDEDRWRRGDARLVYALVVVSLALAVIVAFLVSSP
jgi:hypothetical protein